MFSIMHRSCQRRLDAHNNRRQLQNRVFGFHRRRRLGAKPRAAGAVSPAAAEPDMQQADTHAQEAGRAADKSGGGRNSSGADADSSGDNGASSNVTDVGDGDGAWAVESIAKQPLVRPAPVADLSFIVAGDSQPPSCCDVSCRADLLSNNCI